MSETWSTARRQMKLPHARLTSLDDDNDDSDDVSGVNTTRRCARRVNGALASTIETTRHGDDCV